MNLTEMRARVRRDLHDEDAENYRWTNDELDRHISHAVRELSEALPREQKSAIATISGSREIDVSSLTERVIVQAAEYPVDKYPRCYVRFALWQDTLTLLIDQVPDGSDANIYWGKLHTLDAEGSTIPSQHEDLVAVGTEGYALVEWAAFSINRVNIGGTGTPAEFAKRGRQLLDHFRRELKRLSRRSRVRVSQLYKPHYPPTSQATDWGP